MEREVESWLTHLDVERGLSQNTLAAYRHDLERYTAYLTARGVADLHQVDEATVGEFLGHLRQGDADHPALAASSASRALVAVRGLHTFLASEGEMDEDPTIEVRPPRLPSRLPKAMTITEVEQLLDAVSVGDSPASLRNRALLEVLYGAGARISEAVGLDVDDIDRADGVIRLYGKGRKERLVPLGSWAASALDAYLVRARPAFAERGPGTPAVFLNRLGRRLSRQSAWSVIKAAAERAQLGEHISPHTLRHSFATHLLDGGADVRVVQELLGHASVTTTQIYTMVTVHHLREVYAQSHPRAR